MHRLQDWVRLKKNGKNMKTAGNLISLNIPHLFYLTSAKDFHI